MYHHRIPCYGDLTPGIPGVVDSKPAERLTKLLDDDDVRSTLPASRVQRPASGVQVSGSDVFACIRLKAGSRHLPAVRAVARDFSPRVMTASECEVLVDISGLGRLIGPPEEIARQLAHATFDAGLAVSVAIGPTQTTARLLAHAETPGGPWLQLPVELLRALEVLPRGTNDRDRARPYETLQRWGIERLGDLAALPPADLSSRLGRRGVSLQQLARGRDLRPFVPDREAQRFIERLELEWPIDNLEPLSFVLARLLEPLSDALERADRGAVAIRLELRLIDRSTFSRVLPLPVPMREARVLRTLIMLALESSPPPAGIDLVSIELDPAPARIVRFSLLERALPSPETVATLTGRLSALVGESRVGSAVLLDSHQPDAFEMARFALDTRALSRRCDEVAKPDADAVLRRQRIPPAIRVAVERGRPVHVASSKRGIPYGSVMEAGGPWRTSGGWWMAPEARGGRLRAGGWNRDEWDVALKSGAVCRIYRDRVTDRWFLEGIYD